MAPMKKMLMTGLGVAVILTGSLAAQVRLIDRAAEAKKYAELQRTEGIQDRGLKKANAELAGFQHLVAMAQTDRTTRSREEVDPQDFRNTFRQIKFTPRNTYVRYVEDIEDLNKDAKGNVKGNFIMAGLGDAAELNAKIKGKVDEANRVFEAAKKSPNFKKNLKATAITFNQKRKGIELTVFDFLYTNIGIKHVASGSRRKSVTLYYKAAGAGKANLDMVVTKVVHDRLLEGVRHVLLIIDPSPMDDNNSDIIFIDRYNQKPATITILGMMSNSPNYPHRTEFKQKFYLRLLDEFTRLYGLVDNYSRRDGNSYNEEVLKKLNRSKRF